MSPIRSGKGHNLHGRGVDRVADLLKLEFQIDKANSEDKRTVLETSAFGYRSVHLIARLKGTQRPAPSHRPNRERGGHSILSHGSRSTPSPATPLTSNAPNSSSAHLTPPSATPAAFASTSAEKKWSAKSPTTRPRRTPCDPLPNPQSKSTPHR